MTYIYTYLHTLTKNLILVRKCNFCLSPTVTTVKLIEQQGFVSYTLLYKWITILGFNIRGEPRNSTIRISQIVDGACIGGKGIILTQRSRRNRELTNPGTIFNPLVTGRYSQLNSKHAVICIQIGVYSAWKRFIYWQLW